MSCRFYDNAIRILVESESRNVEHLVELDAFDWTGRCACEDFQFRCLPDLEKGVRDPSLRCKHIKIAAEWLYEKLTTNETKKSDQKEPGENPGMAQQASQENPSPVDPESERGKSIFGKVQRV